jgi:hypothetical protein
MPRKGTCPVSGEGMWAGDSGKAQPGPKRGQLWLAPSKAPAGPLSALLSVLLDKKEVLPTPVTKPKLDSAVYKVSCLPGPLCVSCSVGPHSVWVTP